MTTTDPSPVSVGDRDVALDNEILRTLVGSDVHGMAINGTDDRDEMGVYVEPPELVLGLEWFPEHYVSRTQPEGARSGPGDVDLTIYSLRKYLRLATAGNPSILVPLFVSDADVILSTPIGDELRELAPAIVSMHAGWRFSGYLHGQRMRMVGEGPRQNRVPKRPELIERHGFDTKYASHALRLGYQGLELVTTGRLTLPLSGQALEECVAMKSGRYTFEESLQRIDALQAKLLAALESGTSPLPPEADRATVNAWLVDAHLRHWAR